jgi:hypothetical protein
VRENALMTSKARVDGLVLNGRGAIFTDKSGQAQMRIGTGADC